MTISTKGVQKWVQERVQNDRHNLHAKHPCGFQATFPVQRLTKERAAFWPVSLPTSLHRLALQGFFMALWNGLMLPA